jgi:hypothetical protein
MSSSSQSPPRGRAVIASVPGTSTGTLKMIVSPGRGILLANPNLFSRGHSGRQSAVGCKLGQPAPSTRTV